MASYMSDTAATPEQWRALYDTALTIRRIAPWQWMWDRNMISVDDPQTGVTFYCSVLGANFEALGVVTYIGDRGYASFRRMTESRSQEEAERHIVWQRSLNTFFHDRKDLGAEDLAIIEDLGLPAKGDRPWPRFTSYHPGQPPAGLTGAEVRVLTLVLDQVCDVAARARNDHSLLNAPAPDMILARLPELDVAGNLSGWREQWRTPPAAETPAGEQDPAIVFDRDPEHSGPRLERGGVWEIGLTPLPIQIAEDPSNPYTLHVCMVIDQKSGAVLESKIGRPEVVKESVQEVLAQAVEKMGWNPGSVRSEDPAVTRAISGHCRQAGFSAVTVDRLQSYPDAVRSLAAHLIENADRNDSAAVTPEEGPATAEGIIAFTDAFCLEFLDREYAMLCRKLAHALADVDPSPLSFGPDVIWACATIHAVGSLNSLFDESLAPYLSEEDLCARFGFTPSMIAQGSAMILQALCVHPGDPEWSRRATDQTNPLAWMLRVEGIPVDARELPEDIQLALHSQGTIPVPPFWLLLASIRDRIDTLERDPLELLLRPEAVEYAAGKGEAVVPGARVKVVGTVTGGSIPGIHCSVSLSDNDRVLVLPLTMFDPVPGDPLAGEIIAYRERSYRSIELTERLERLTKERLARENGK